jgi:hypothetical protein
MKSKQLLLTVVLLSTPMVALAAETVTVENFVRAETDMTLDRYVKQGGFGKFLHIRKPTPIDKQDVIRMNRDTLYSIGVFDLTEPVTITKPDSEGRFMSMMLVNQNHSIPPAIHDSGKFTFTKEEIGTRYLCIIMRTFVDASNPSDVEIANACQDKITVIQSNPGSFEIPDWDEQSLHKVRNAVNVLAATKADTSGYFGLREKLDPIDHLLGTAFGWGGNPKEAAMYINVTPEKNDGKTPHTLTISKKVPVDGFVSVTIYNADGFMEKNEQDAYSVNNVTAKRNDDGSVVIHFGGDPKNPNYLPITPGWNYIVRLYQPGKEILDGSWTFPAPVEAQ